MHILTNCIEACKLQNTYARMISKFASSRSATSWNSQILFAIEAAPPQRDLKFWTAGFQFPQFNHLRRLLILELELELVEGIVY